jgi:predicted transcriptional regulator
MKSKLTIRLEADLERRLELLARRLGRTPSELARELLQRQIAPICFSELRQKVLPFAESRGWLTDEDVFRDVS